MRKYIKQTHIAFTCSKLTMETQGHCALMNLNKYRIRIISRVPENFTQCFVPFYDEVTRKLQKAFAITENFKNFKKLTVKHLRRRPSI